MMRKLSALLAVAFVLVSGPLAAAEMFLFEKNGQPYGMLMPDDYWFDRPLIAPISVIPLDREATKDYCSREVQKNEDMGCSVTAGHYYCNVIIDETLPKPVYDAVLKHETAHCHGWTHD